MICTIREVGTLPLLTRDRTLKAALPLAKGPLPEVVMSLIRILIIAPQVTLLLLLQKTLIYRQIPLVHLVSR